jgi:hypothetical protein
MTPINLDTFLYRLSKIGIDLQLGLNFPWTYISYINGTRVTEKHESKHGFVLGYYPIRQSDDKFKFGDLSPIFRLIRMYVPVSYDNMADDYVENTHLDKDTYRGDVETAYVVGASDAIRLLKKQLLKELSPEAMNSTFTWFQLERILNKF